MYQIIEIYFIASECFLFIYKDIILSFLQGTKIILILFSLLQHESEGAYVVILNSFAN